MHEIFTNLFRPNLTVDPLSRVQQGIDVVQNLSANNAYRLLAREAYAGVTPIRYTECSERCHGRPRPRNNRALRLARSRPRKAHARNSCDAPNSPTKKNPSRKHRSRGARIRVHAMSTRLDPNKGATMIGHADTPPSA